jgi:Ca2+-binding EF-hand superfamily protein
MRTHIAGLIAAFSTLTLAAQDEPDLFTKLDTNKDGFVTADEVPEANKTLFERLLRNADKNSDSKLSKEEFQAGLRPAEGPRPSLDGGAGRPGQPGNPAARPDPRQAEQMFAQADRNNDGKLTKDEIPEDRRERFSQMLERLNPGGDSLTKEQFVRGMMFMAQGAPPAPGNRPNPANFANREQFEALFDRTDSNSDGKLTKDEIPEERQGMRLILDRAGGESITKEQFVRGMMAMAQNPGQPPRPEGAPPRRPDGPPGGPPPGGGLFAALDTDRDGQLSNAEIVGAGSALLKLDRNNDGKLTPDEIFAGGPGAVRGSPDPARPGDARPGEPRRPGDGQPPGQRRPGQPGDQSPEAFRERLKQADTNNDGKLSKDEAPPFLKERFDRLDTNSDGFIDQEETRRLLDQRPRDGAPPNRRPNGDQSRRNSGDKN